MGGSSGELQDLTNRLVDRATAYGIKVSTEKSKIMTNSTNNISGDISNERPEVKGGDQFQLPGSNPPQEWHLPSRSPHQDCLSHGSDGQTKDATPSTSVYLERASFLSKWFYYTPFVQNND